MTTLNYTVPAAGSTLNSVADPELSSALTAILAWANGNVDTNNLSASAAIKGSQLAANAGIMGTQLASSAGITAGQLAAGATSWLTITSTGVSVTAAAGQLVKTTGAPVTVTLPAPAADARVGVVATGSVSGASPVTVAAGANVIQGIGLSNASSFPLGTVGSFALLQSDGTNWFVISGQQDSGWQALILSTGMSGYNVGTGSPVPGARLVGDRVYLRGSVTQGASGNSATSIATLPSASMYPTIPVAWSGTFLAGPYTAGAYNVSSSGVLAVTTNAGNGGIFFFEGLNFSLSD